METNGHNVLLIGEPDGSKGLRCPILLKSSQRKNGTFESNFDRSSLIFQIQFQMFGQT